MNSLPQEQPALRTRAPLSRMKGMQRMGRDERALLRQAVYRYSEHDMGTYSSALAFQGFFSIFPFLLFLVALLAFIRMPQFFDWLHQQAQVFVPAQAMSQVMDVLEQIKKPRGGILSFGIAAALWGASGAVRAAMGAMNLAYGIAEHRPAWLRVALSILHTLVLATLLVAAAAAALAGPTLIHPLGLAAGIQSELLGLWNWLRWPLWLLLLIASVTYLHLFTPAERPKLSTVLPGAALSVLAWVVASLAFDFYVANFSNYSALYGGIGAVIALLLYFSLSASVLLLGAELNAVRLQRKTGLNFGEPAREEDVGTLLSGSSQTSNRLEESR